MPTHRNAPCPCGSGKKYRTCCRPKQQPHNNPRRDRKGKLQQASYIGDGWRAPCYSCKSESPYLYCCYTSDYELGKLPKHLQEPKTPGVIPAGASRLLYLLVLILFLCLLVAFTTVFTQKLRDSTTTIIASFAGNPLTMITAIFISIGVSHLLAFFLVNKIPLKCRRCWGASRINNPKMAHYTCSVCKAQHVYFSPWSPSDTIRPHRM